MFSRNGELIEKKFMQYLLSTILMSMALSLGTIVDGIIASNLLGTDSLGAINTCQPIILIFGAIYSVFGVGGSTLAATALGAGRKNDANSYFTLAISALIFFGVLVTVIGIFAMDKMVELTTSGSSLGALAKDYLSVLVYGAIILFVVPGLSFFIRTDGKPVLAALILIVANAVNLLSDIVYIKFLNFGIKGAALATLTGYFVGIFVSIPYFVSKTRFFHFSFKGLRIKQLGEIFLCGLPNAINSVLMTVKMLVLNRTAIATLGDNGASAVAICNNCLSFASIFIGGTAQTMLPIIGVLYGENDRNGMISAVKKALKIVLIAGAIMIVCFEFFPTQISKLFNVETEELMAISVMAVRLFGLSLPFFAIVYVFMSFYQGTGKRSLAITITVCEGLVFIVPFIFILNALISDRGIGIWLSFVCTEICTLVLIFIMSRVVSARTNKEGILLLDPESDKTLDFSIKTTLENAVEISKKISNFCRENGVDNNRSDMAGLAVEEMVVNTIIYGYKNKSDENIDVFVGIQAQEIIIRIRDSGIPFNPLEFLPKEDEESIEYKIGGINILKQMSHSSEYSRALGFNNLVIKI